MTIQDENNEDVSHNAWPNVTQLPTTTSNVNQNSVAIQPPTQAQEDEKPIDLLHYMALARRHLVLIGMVLGVSVVLAGLWTLRQPKIYAAETSIIINSRAPNVLTNVKEVTPAGGGNYWATEYFYRTEYKVLESRIVAQGAAELLSLGADDVHNGLADIKDESLREEMRQNLDIADLVRSQYRVEPDKKSRVARIVAEHTDPVFVAQLANAVAQSYLDQNLDQKTSSTREASTWLAVQHQDLKKKLEDSELALFSYMSENNVLNASLESQEEEVQQRLLEFNARLAATQAKRIESILLFDALKEARQNNDILDSLEEMRNTGIISNLKNRLVVLEETRSDLELRYKLAHPKIKTVNKQIRLVKENLRREVDGLLLGLERSAKSLISTERGLKEAIAKERDKEAFLNKLKLKYIRLKREVTTNKRLFDLVTGRLKETDLSGMLRVNNAFILDKAEVPIAPFSPSLKRNVFLGAFFGSMIAFLLVVLLEIADNTLRTHEEVQNVLGANFLGVLPVIKDDDTEDTSIRTRTETIKVMHHKDLYIAQHPKSVPAECMRSIRTNLLFMSPDKHLKTMAVTSALPQEGKTTTAISLAVTMAQSGSRTLLVDTDMRRPRLHRSFGLGNEEGISSVIVGEKTIDEVIQTTEVENLDLFVCGPVPPNPAELLHTQSFINIFNSLKTRYDRVIFDTPPVGAVTDPVILSALVDGTVLVVKSGKTTRQIGRQAVKSLEDANGRLLGVILNDVELAKKKYGYYYSKYYRYGSYYGGQYGGYGEYAQDEEKPDDDNQVSA
jgi:polysaccharide biosynthesis transport protein